MWRKLLSKNIIPYTITLLVILIDFAIVMMVTLWTPEFTIDKLSTADFWLTQAIKTLVALVGYFAFIYLGSVIMRKSNEIVSLKYQVQQNYDFVNANLLIDDRDEFVDIKNTIEKGKSYLNFLDKKLRKIKPPDIDNKNYNKKIEKRKAINAEKVKVASLIAEYQAKLFDKTAMTETVKLADKGDFNINSVKNIDYFKIDKRLLDGSDASQSGHVLGYFNSTKHIIEDLLLKIIPSSLLIALISMILPGVFKGDSAAIQAAIYLSFIVLINCLFGWLEGVTIVMKYGRAALNEIKGFYGDFFNYCVKIAKLDKPKLIAHNEKNHEELKERFAIPQKQKK